MESKLLLLVKKMHEKFGLQNDNPAGHLSEEEKKFRIVAMREELTEYEYSTELVDEYDALIDLLVFTVGTFERHGFPLQQGFEIVMQKNMQKELAGSSEKSKRGFSRDLVKPSGWTAPEQELQELLNNLNNDAALKYDSNKTRFDLIPASFYKYISTSLNVGQIKYGKDNWRTGKPIDASRTYASVMRHLTEWFDGLDVDESGSDNLDCALAQLLFLRYNLERCKNSDDRFNKGV
jgi:hypothetical protein